MCTSCCKLYLLCESAKYINRTREREKFHNSGICTISTLHPRISFVHVNLGQPSHRRIVTHAADTISVLHNARLVSKKKKKGGEERKREKNCRKQKKKADGFFFFLQEVKLKILFRPSLLSETGSCLIIEKNEGGKGC